MINWIKDLFRDYEVAHYKDLCESLDKRHEQNRRSMNIDDQRWIINGELHTGTQLAALIPVFERAVYASSVGYSCRLGPYEIERVK